MPLSTILQLSGADPGFVVRGESEYARGLGV
jgi:hypothetical protein